MSSVSTVKQLIEDRDALDRDIDEYREILKANNVDMNSPLVDLEGFPRNDIDVYSVRDARVKIIRLQNDRAALTKQIEEQLGELHSATSNDSRSETEPVVHRTTNQPFLKISTVTEDSPADEGGLKVDDLIVQFGPLHGDNYENLEQLSNVMKNHLEKTLKVTVLRDTRVYRLTFQPREWGGRGIFGAGFVPLSTSNIL